MNKPIMVLVSAAAIFALGAGVYATAPSKSDTQTAATSKAARQGDKAKGEKAKGEKGHDEKGHGEEGVVEMSDARVASSNIEILSARTETLHDSLVLNGILQPNQETLVQVTPRFPGVVREIKKRIGDTVEKGELLAKIESNQSLSVYEMRAPISGTVIDRQISLGEYASEQKPAFIVADISTVWVDLSVYRRNLPRVRIGDKILIDVGDGGKPIEAQPVLHLAGWQQRHAERARARRRAEYRHAPAHRPVRLGTPDPVGQAGRDRRSGVGDPDGREPQRRLRP